VIKMREPDRTQLPFVESFGGRLERAIASRSGSRRRTRRRALGLAFAAGLVAASLMTAPGRAASDLVGEWLGLAEPGDPATVEGPRQRAADPVTQPAGATVLAAGRAPDGVRYEFVLENFAGRQNSPIGDFRTCLNLEWPDTGQISPQFGCYMSFPPAVLDEAVVKLGGLIFDNTTTSHVQIAGLARSDVGDVRILYKDEHGARRDAPVNFAMVSNPVRERAGADGPVGVLIGFLPPAWLGYGANYDPRHCPPKKQADDPEAVEVIAYDHQGRELSRETGSNLLSLSGRPPCR
jgi:hypothetical protein